MIKEKIATKKQFEKEVAKHGASVDMFDSFFNVDTPKGKLWASNGCSTIVAYFATGATSYKPQAYAQAIEDMQGGLTDAPDDYEGAWWDDEFSN